jgi:hypothetical protein
LVAQFKGKGKIHGFQELPRAAAAAAEPEKTPT